MPREFHVNPPTSAPDSAPGGTKRGESSTIASGSGSGSGSGSKPGKYLTKREAAEIREQEAKDKATRPAGSSMMRAIGKVLRSVS